MREHGSRQRRAARNPGLLVDVMDVDAHSPLREVQPPRHLLVRESLRDKQHDLALARRQHAAKLLAHGSTAGLTLDRRSDKFAWELPSPLSDNTDTAGHFADGAVFQQERSRPLLD